MLPKTFILFVVQILVLGLSLLVIQSQSFFISWNNCHKNKNHNIHCINIIIPKTRDRNYYYSNNKHKCRRSLCHQYSKQQQQQKYTSSLTRTTTTMSSSSTFKSILLHSSNQPMNDNHNDTNNQSDNDRNTFSELKPLLLQKTLSSSLDSNYTDENYNNYITRSDENSSTTSTRTPKTSIRKRILDLAIPASVALLIDPLMSVVDTVFVGRFYHPPMTATADDIVTSTTSSISSVASSSGGASPLAGMGSATAVLTFTFYLFNFLCTATTPLVAQYRAAAKQQQQQQQQDDATRDSTSDSVATNDYVDDRVVKVSGQALSLSLIVGILVTIGLLVFGPSILYNIMGTSYTGTSANVYSVEYLQIRSLAAPFILCIEASIGIFRGYLDTRTPVVVLLFANTINIVLDIIFVIQYNMGPNGAAIATTIAEMMSCILFLLILQGTLPSAGVSNEDNDGIRELGSNQIIQTTIQNSVDENDTSNNDIQQRKKQKKVVIVPLLSVPRLDEVQPLLIASSSLFFRSLVLQLSLSAAAAMAARTGHGIITGTGLMDSSMTDPDVTTATTVLLSSSSSKLSTPVSSASYVAAHQIGIQLWLLCSFFCDSLAAASQGLIADAIGRNNQQDIHEIVQVVFVYSILLGTILAIGLQIGTSTGLLYTIFTTDRTIQIVLASIIPYIILAQPLNAIVFTADGILQGSSQFVFQAQAMIVSGIVALVTFLVLEQGIPIISSILLDNGSVSSSSSDVATTITTTTLIHVWMALVTLQIMRGITSLYKIIDPNGPINILKIKPQPDKE